MSDAPKQIEAEFLEAMLDVYRAVSEVVARPARFHNMLGQHGAVETARQLICKDELQGTFIDLAQLGRLDLSVEALVLQPKYRELFTEAELQKAEDRLVCCGYDASKLA